jgi:CBS domain-containing protein
MPRGASGIAGAVGAWMSKPPVAVAEDTPIRVAMAHMEGAEVRHLLVMDGPILTGIVSNRDLGRVVTRDVGSPLLSEPVRSIMSEGPVSVAPETLMVTAARLLLEHRIGALPVRDGDRIVGIFTVADALEALLATVEGSGS